MIDPNEQPPISDAEKVRIAADFLQQSPPGEFNEVFNDVRVLLNNDPLLEKGCRGAIANYNKDQFVPVRVEQAPAAGGENPRATLITPHNELADGRFVDPKSAKVFKYDHLRKEALDVEPIGSGKNAPGELDEKLEPWRKALQAEVDEYIHEHYYRGGVATVFTQKGSGSVVLCIESHQFQPKNYWNGRWRSEWRIPAYVEGHKKESTGVHECTGTIRLQVHYYEDGNVQLISQKDSKLEIKFTPDIHATAKEAIRLICEHESKYQVALQESYAHLSENTFKALRRQLPVTRAKLDWLKLHSYRIAQDIKPQ